MRSALRQRFPPRPTRAGSSTCFAALAFALVISLASSIPALAATAIREGGTIAAQIDGRYLRKGGSIVAEVEGDSVRRGGSVVLRFDGRHIRRGGTIVATLDGRDLRVDGRISWEIESSGAVRQGGRIRFHIDGGADSDDTLRMVAAYLLLFAD
jgi:hypothetical protein